MPGPPFVSAPVQNAGLGAARRMITRTSSSSRRRFQISTNSFVISRVKLLYASGRLRVIVAIWSAISSKDRKSVVEGTRVSVRVDRGGGGYLKKKKKKEK